jgi:hypothetical protein
MVPDIQSYYIVGSCLKKEKKSFRTLLKFKTARKRTGEDTRSLGSVPGDYAMKRTLITMLSHGTSSFLVASQRTLSASIQASLQPHGWMLSSTDCHRNPHQRTPCYPVQIAHIRLYHRYWGNSWRQAFPGASDGN